MPWTCPLCKRTTHNPNDIEEQYCSCCGNSLLPKDCEHAIERVADGQVIVLRAEHPGGGLMAAVVVGKAFHVHAYDGKKTKWSWRAERREPRTICGQVFDRSLGHWQDHRYARCAKCVRLMDARLKKESNP